MTTSARSCAAGLYELVAVAGGWRHQTRKQHAEAIRAAMGVNENAKALTKAEAGVLTAVAYFQPVTRGDLGETFGREVGRDQIASLRAQGLIAAGPRSPQPGAPYAYVTTPAFRAQFGFESLRDLPDLERLQDAGLLGATDSDQEAPRQFGPRNDDAPAFDWVSALDPAEIDEPREGAA